MLKQFPHSTDKKYDDTHFSSMIKEREETISIIRVNNLKKRRKKGKKTLTIAQATTTLNDEDLRSYLEEQGFTLGK